MAFNRKQKLRDNIEAVRTAFTLDRERRTPTERERALLERYCGFGGLKCILNPARELSDAVHWAKSDLELFAPTVELHRIIRENSRDDIAFAFIFHDRDVIGKSPGHCADGQKWNALTVTFGDMMGRLGRTFINGSAGRTGRFEHIAFAR